MFVPVLGIVLVLLVGLVGLLCPSVACEFAPPAHARDGTRLGAWVTNAGRTYTRFASWVIFASAHIALLWAARAFGGLDFLDLSAVSDASHSALRWISLSLAGGTAGLLVVGSRVFGELGKVRTALDVALDVDRHFREFPASGTSRGRIAARLYSAIVAARDAGYGRIVISSHSQGTVIAGELLRYVAQRFPNVHGTLPEIHLFTCGCPLRQLYAARFPTMYGWVVRKDASGPLASELGVVSWTNAYCTGDYVGRWLWEPAGHDLTVAGLDWEDSARGHRQVCVGKGAHTHYYDSRMATVAREIDRLV
jgi:hypothetical protein